MQCFNKTMLFNFRGNKKSRGSGSSQQKSSGQGTNKHSKDGSDKPEKIKGRHGRNSIAFHRRSTLTDDILQHEVDLVTQRIPNVYGGFKTPVQGPPGGGIPSLRNTSFGEQSVDSPHSAAPSPLVATQIAPSVNQNTDPTMPTLSPHPPTKNSDKDLNSSMTSSTGDPAENSHNNSTTTNGTDVYNKQPQSASKQENFTSIFPQQNGIDHIKQEPGSMATNMHKHSELKGLKRPVLPTKGYEERDEELITESLYDYNSLNAW